MNEENGKQKCKCGNFSGGAHQSIYGFGVIGAAIYYLQQATSFTDGFFGICKAIGWPAVIVYQVLKTLHL